MKGTITNDRTRSKVYIQHRGETEIHTAGTQFGCQNIARLLRQMLSALWVLIPNLAQLAHRRNTRKALAKTLYPAAFVIHRNQQWRAAQPMDTGGQFSELPG